MGAGKEKSAIKCVAFLIEQILTHKKRKKLKRDRIKVTERGGNTGKERERGVAAGECNWSDIKCNNQ